MLSPPSGRVRRSGDAAVPTGEPGSLYERTGESGDELDEISLAAGVGLSVKAAKVGLHRRSGYAERPSDLGNPPTSTIASSTRNSVGVSL